MKSSEECLVQIHHWLENSFPQVKQLELGFDDSLWESGVVDSLGTLSIVMFLENEFGIQISDDDMLADHFESSRAIARFVQSKTAVSN